MMRSVNFSSATRFVPVATNSKQSALAAAMLPKDAFVKIPRPLFGEGEGAGEGAASGESQSPDGKPPRHWKDYIGLAVPGALVLAIGSCAYLLITNDSSSPPDPSKPAAVDLVEIGKMRGLPVMAPKSLAGTPEGKALCREALEHWNVPKGQEIKPGDQFTCSDGKDGKIRITAVPHKEISG